ncbi:hypothetical protein EYF80_011566 [Liparis tanakae]|uniref:Uncharacterized protein n=1 Tax=Liparis tanakae TaxID=230148 RepID=A0A4Z2IKC7_9TELE|nr:hypothetical protein EYF80_011566 [Liparis tanakae]
MHRSEHEDHKITVTGCPKGERAHIGSRTQVEIVGQDFEVGRDVGFGFCLPLEPEASASLVYLLQQLGGGRRDNSLCQSFLGFLVGHCMS